MRSCISGHSLIEYRCKLVYASFKGADQFSVDAVVHYERAFAQAEQNGIKIRALIITNPHNPLGTATGVLCGLSTNACIRAVLSVKDFGSSHALLQRSLNSSCE